ncbi:MAG: 16S rRNA (cytidine(1402)-2'-O)-methyltransferase [Acidimicrobiia bacterium]|nr:16S rRNA (cytidine(1402)-2'-O)-methyltransferase [Acidimicrobiia bacterium]
MGQGRLFVCATPIGNLGDVSERLREVLALADVIYAEDTRRTAKLLSRVGSQARLRSLFAGNEKSRTRELIDDVRSGLDVVLLSDAGMPAVSDPGGEAVSAALDEGLKTTVIPGPSAVTAAIALSGFGGDRFVFEGFLPRRAGERTARLTSLATETRPIVLFASPKRLGEDLSDLRDALGSERSVAVLKELTKIHEQVWRGSLEEAAAKWAGDQKGEFTLVVGRGQIETPNIADAVNLALSLVAGGSSRSDAAREAASVTGVARREIYEKLVRSTTS